MADAGVLAGRQVGAGVLASLFYVPDFLSADEEARLLAEVHSSRAKWVQLSGRRLQNHGGLVHAKGLAPAPMPRWLEGLAARLRDAAPGLFGDGGAPNHVLINAYPPGCGIMPHQDGPLYHPAVCIVSAGAPAVLRFWRKAPEGGTGGAPPVASILALPRSLLVFRDDAYHDCLHGIEERRSRSWRTAAVQLQRRWRRQRQALASSETAAAALASSETATAAAAEARQRCRAAASAFRSRCGAC
ncbi:Alkbh6 [Scenedesmus sp. PABB004]|nr:Alkbh6 [Scenedesmus sp. PABB004]